jgi:hypothetical protein
VVKWGINQGDTRMTTSTTTVVFRIIGSDVFEVPVQDVGSYAEALDVALEFFGLTLDAIVVCLPDIGFMADRD